METIKTALVVILLLVVLFGVYTVLNKPDPQPPREVAWGASSGPSPLSLDISMGGDASSPGSSGPGSISPFPGPAAPSSTPFSPPSATPPTQPAWPPSELKRDESPRGGGESASDSPVRASNGSADPLAATRPNSPTIPGFPADDAPLRGAATAIPPPDLMLPTRGGDDSVGALRSPLPATPADGGRAAAPSPAGDSLPGRSFEPAAPDRRTEFGDAADAVAGTRHSLADRGPQMQNNPYFNEPAGKASGDTSPAGQNAGGPVGDPLAGNPQAGGQKATQAGVSLYSKGANFDRELRAAQSLVEGRQWREALLSLSQLCQEPNLSTAQQARLYDLLDPLAAKVIYSTEHLIEGPYTVQRGETLKSIGQQFNVPWELLRNINAVRNPDVLVPGSTLKVVRGPFRADVDLAAREMTLYAEQLYAGRFPISVGSEPSPHPGEYEVRAKELGRTFYGRDGQSLAATDPRNPYGQRLLDLGREVSIHGSPEVDGGAAAQGCVGLSPRDAEDVFAILSHGSKVSIRR